jgi:outer membrane protein TolC
MVCVAAVGCTRALPDVTFAGGAAGLHEPIEFVTAVTPTDVAGGVMPKLTMEDAVRHGMQHSPSVQAAIAEVHAALADARQARLIPNPVINLALRFPEGGGKPVIEASLAADLVSLLLRPRQISAADNRLRAAAAEALTAVLDQLAEVQERYVTVQSLDAQSAVLDRRRTLIQRLLNLAKARVEAGESSTLDVITLDTQRVSLDVAVAQAASERREQRLALARLLGQPSGPVDWELSPWTPGALAPTDEMQWVRAALEHRPEVQAHLWELTALGDEVALTRVAVFDTGDIGVEAERDGDWSVGPAISMPLPLLDWGQQRRAKAEAQRIAARHRLTQTRRQVVEEVRRALESLTASQAAVRKVQAELIPLAEQRVQQSEAAYKNGLADVTAVLFAEQEAQAAQATLIELQQKSSSAFYRLQRAVGGAGIASATSPAVTTQITEHP